MCTETRRNDAYVFECEGVLGELAGFEITDSLGVHRYKRSKEEEIQPEQEEEMTNKQRERVAKRKEWFELSVLLQRRGVRIMRSKSFVFPPLFPISLWLYLRSLFLST